MNPFTRNKIKSTTKVQANINTELLNRLYEIHKGEYISYALTCAIEYYVKANSSSVVKDEEKPTNTSTNPPIRFKGRVYRSVSDMPAYLYKEYIDEMSNNKDDEVSKNKEDGVPHPIGFDWGDTEMSKKTEPTKTNLVDRDEESKRKKAEEKEEKEREHWKNFDWKKYTGDAS